MNERKYIERFVHGKQLSDWRSESAYLGRYAGSGMLNTLVGFAVIFVLIGLGVSPTISNVGGYLVGLILGFFVAKGMSPLREFVILPRSLPVLP